MEKRSLIKSLNYAAEGIIHVLRTQRNMRIHFAAAALVLIFSLFINLSRAEFAILLFAIALVLVTELINTAVEATIDLVSTTYDPMAMIAKDVAAGAVLLASINALVVGYLIFFERLTPFTMTVLSRVRSSPVHITFIGLLLVMLVAIVGKVLMGRGTPFRGGMPSVHSALAFSAFLAITLIAHQFASGRITVLLSSLALLMALLVCQTRIETGVHSFFEVTIGALLGLLVTVLIWQVYFIYAH